MTKVDKYAADLQVGDYWPHGLQSVEIEEIGDQVGDRVVFHGHAQRRGLPVAVSETVHREALVLTEHFGPHPYRRFKSTSTYVDGFARVRYFGLVIDPDLDEDALTELLQVESGAGHFGPNGEAVDAHYEITSIDGIEPAIHWEATG